MNFVTVAMLDPVSQSRNCASAQSLHRTRREVQTPCLSSDVFRQPEWTWGAEQHISASTLQPPLDQAAALPRIAIVCSKKQEELLRRQTSPTGLLPE